VGGGGYKAQWGGGKVVCKCQPVLGLPRTGKTGRKTRHPWGFDPGYPGWKKKGRGMRVGSLSGRKNRSPEPNGGGKKDRVEKLGERVKNPNPKEEEGLGSRKGQQKAWGKPQTLPGEKRENAPK